MKDNVVIIKTAEWMSALETIETQKNYIVELEEEIEKLQPKKEGYTWKKPWNTEAYFGPVEIEFHLEKPPEEK